MSIGSLRGGTAVVACALALASAAPALAETPGAPELDGVADVLAADLSSAEEHALSDLTAGDGVRLSAFVETPDGAEVVSFDAHSRADAERAVSLLDAQPSVLAADVAGRVRVAAGSMEQYGNAMVRSDDARVEAGSAISDVVVAVLDTGVAAHPELQAALLPGQNLLPGADPLDTADHNGHGTHVAGTIGADAGSSVEGIAAGARILPVKVLDDGGAGYWDWVAGGVVWATDHGADVINMSLGGQSEDSVLGAAIDYAHAHGVTIVAAAGNWNVSEPFYPAAFPGVIGVSAVDDQRAKAGFSNYGSYVDVAGPGVNVLSTVPDAGYDRYSGTSMASPHVAGVVALAKAVGPTLTPDQVELAIEGTATDLGAPGRDDVFGHGLIDAVRTVQAAEALEETGVWPGNEAPVAPDRTVTSRYTPGNLRVDVLAGAGDPDGDTLTLAAFTQGTNGTVRRSGAQLIWSPLRSGPFTDTFTYTVDDGWAGRATGTVTISVGAPDPANRAPVARADGILFMHEMPEGAITYLLENDSDPDGDPLRIVNVAQPALGTTSIDQGMVVYVKPDGIWGTGVDSFRYTVTDDRGRFAAATVLVDIRHPNSLPVAHDDQVRLAEGAVSLDLFPAGNDTDPDSDDWRTVTEVGTAQHGDVMLLPENRVRYTPSGDLPVGTTDSFTYTVQDGFWGTAQATVHVTVVEPAAPSAPGVGTVTPGKGSAVVRWSAPADPGTSAVSGYVVKAYASGTLVRSLTAAATARSLTVTGLTNGRAHTFRVSATNAAGTGPASAASASVTPRTVPTAPKLGTVSPAKEALVVRWAAPASNGGSAITGYLVRTYSGGYAQTSTTVSASARTLTVRSLVATAPYTVRVQAINAAGGGTWSAASAVVRPNR
jgi:subtilisin family serine protease